MEEKKKPRIPWTPFAFAWNWTIPQLGTILHQHQEETEEGCPSIPPCQGSPLIGKQTRATLLTHLYKHWQHRQPALEHLVHALFDAHLAERQAIKSSARQRRDLSLCGVMIGVRFQDTWHEWRRIFEIIRRTDKVRARASRMSLVSL